LNFQLIFSVSSEEEIDSTELMRREEKRGGGGRGGKGSSSPLQEDFARYSKRICTPLELKKVQIVFFGKSHEKFFDLPPVDSSQVLGLW
jgi:hypothetical protein